MRKTSKAIVTSGRRSGTEIWIALDKLPPRPPAAKREKLGAPVRSERLVAEQTGLSADVRVATAGDPFSQAVEMGVMWWGDSFWIYSSSWAEAVKILKSPGNDLRGKGWPGSPTGRRRRGEGPRAQRIATMTQAESKHIDGIIDAKDLEFSAETRRLWWREHGEPPAEGDKQ